MTEKVCQHDKKVSTSHPHQHWALSFKNDLPVEEACIEIHSGAGTVVGIGGAETVPAQRPCWAAPGVGRDFSRSSVCTNKQHSPLSDILHSKPRSVTHGLVVSEKRLNPSGSQFLQLYNGNWTNISRAVKFKLDNAYKALSLLTYKVPSGFPNYKAMGSLGPEMPQWRKPC